MTSLWTEDSWEDASAVWARLHERVLVVVSSSADGNSGDAHLVDIAANLRHRIAAHLDASTTATTPPTGATTATTPPTGATAATREQVQAIAVALLSAFVQRNYTGPELEESASPLCAQDANLLRILFPATSATTSVSLSAETTTLVRRKLVGSLEVDGEEAYRLVQSPLLLVLALCLLQWLLDRQPDASKSSPSLHLWMARALFVQQQVLEHPTETLLHQILHHLDQCDTVQLGEGEASPSIAKVRLFRGLVYHYYRRDKLAQEWFQKAQKAAGLEWNLTGALGRRTKFQTFDVAQLTMDVKSSLAAVPSSANAAKQQQVDGAPSGTTHLPKQLDLNDDTLLESVQFTDEQAASKKEPLHTLDQCILLAFCLNIKNTNPDHGITQEQMAAFITKTLESPQNFLIHTMALLLRSRIDASRSRTVERGVLQLQALVDQYGITDTTKGGAGVEERMRCVWELPFPSRWMMKKELGEKFLSIGMIVSGRKIFEELEMWEDVVACYQNMEEEKKAEEIVLRLLEEQPDSPKLLCILGDLRKDPTLWEKAWAVSQHRYARAMRSLGSHYYRKQDYQRAMECYQKALAINSLFEASWFTLGCAAMQVDAWEESKRAFMQCVMLEPGNGEAWNNLAAINIKLGKKMDAFRCLREGLKEKYDNWKMWENLLFLSLDLGEFNESIFAIDRLLETRWGKNRESLDVGALRALVEGVVRLTKDLHQEYVDKSEPSPPQFRILERVKGLLERVVEEYATTDAEIWDIYAYFCASQNNLPALLQCRRSAYQMVAQSETGQDASTEYEAFQTMSKVIANLVEAYALCQKEGIITDGPFQSRLVLRNFLKKTQECFEERQEYQKLQGMLADVSVAR